MLLRDYEMPWRRAFEGYAAASWITLSGGALAVDAPWQLSMSVAAVATGMATRRLHTAVGLLKVRACLTGRAVEKISVKRFNALTARPDQVYLGMGFEWLPVHSQRLYELSKVDYRQYAVSPFIQRLLGSNVVPQPEGEVGLPFIHGVEQHEKPLYRPLQNFEGGTLIVGTTQAGKGVALQNLIPQAVRRGDIVIVIDPKNSDRLKRAVKQACERYRSADTFIEFHPAFPETGVRLDFMFNWQKPTEIASRIQSIMPPDTAGAFTAFGWDAVNVVVGGLIDLEERPSLVKLTKYIEGGIEPVLEETLRRYYAKLLGQRWRHVEAMAKLLDRSAQGKLKSPSQTASPELVAMVEYYEQYVPKDAHTKVIDAQVRTYRHNREHYQKITANLLPVLSMLTSGELGRSLSPDPFDPHDKRPIMNYEKIEQGGHVLYMCLDSLPDPSVASAIGALALADLAARAGMRYNLGLRLPIALFVDEVTNVINIPLIEILNKGAEGGIYTTVAMQTLSDMANRLGSEDAARMALGNLNNLIAFRSKDRPTQDFIVETFGETAIHTMRVSMSSGNDVHVGDYSAGQGRMITESMEDRIPSSVLGNLPNLQYVASVAGGRLCKGRFTLIDLAEEVA